MRAMASQKRIAAAHLGTLPAEGSPHPPSDPWQQQQRSSILSGQQQRTTGGARGSGARARRTTTLALLLLLLPLPLPSPPSLSYHVLHLCPGVRLAY